MAVLDRILVSSAWDILYPLAFAQTLFRAGPDHNPLLLILALREPTKPKNSGLRILGFLNLALRMKLKNIGR